MREFIPLLKIVGFMLLVLIAFGSTMVILGGGC